METILYIKHETDVWLELTTLLIPGENDSETELQALTQWVVENLGNQVPLHFSAFHPDWKMHDRTRTPAKTLLMARDIALNNGVNHAYVGNIHNKSAASTYCQSCGELLIGRDSYQLSDWHLDSAGHCQHCGQLCAGHFANTGGG